jgi:hypothetical protein
MIITILIKTPVLLLNFDLSYSWWFAPKVLFCIEIMQILIRTIKDFGKM